MLRNSPEEPPVEKLGYIDRLSYCYVGGMKRAEYISITAGALLAKIIGGGEGPCSMS